MFQAIAKQTWLKAMLMANNQLYKAQLQVRDGSVLDPKTEYIGNINHPRDFRQIVSIFPSNHNEINRYK
jgi:hypothetical protein